MRVLKILIQGPYMCICFRNLTGNKLLSRSRPYARLLVYLHALVHVSLTNRHGTALGWRAGTVPHPALSNNTQKNTKQWDALLSSRLQSYPLLNNSSI